MTELRALTDAEIVELATRLRSLDWSWQLADAAVLASAFGWEVVMTGDDWVMLDAGFGAGSAKLTGSGDQVGEIMVQVTDFADDDAAGEAQTRDAFVGMVAALTGAFGEPTARIPGDVPEVRWAGAETTLVLRDPAVMVELFLMTNAWLAEQDGLIDLEEQGLL
ncbi:DUF6301 family protein [Nocardia sp. CA-128927]|uniref:DUF6301 family protein n=1 Tax=Nocardia sp. CA-128927 TaxID=3239975 RepID=UPI003D988305